MNAIEKTIPLKGKGLGFLNRFYGKILVSFGMLFVGTFLAIFLVFVFGIPFTSVKSLYKAEESKAFHELELVSHLKKERLERWLKERRDDIRLLGKSELITEHASAFIRKSESEPKEPNATLADLRNDGNHELVRQHFLQAKSIYRAYESIAISDMKGRVLLSTNPSEMGVDVSNEEFFLAPLRSFGEVHQEIGMDAFGEGDQDLYVSQALKEQNSDRIIGVLFARIQTEDFVNPLLRAAIGHDATGEAILVNSERKIFVPLKFALPDGSKAIPLKYEDTSQAARLAIGGEEGFVSMEDYRGEPVFASYHYLRISSESRWGLIVKQDRSEVMAKVKEGMEILCSVFLLCGLILGLIAYAISRKLTHPIEHLTRISSQVRRGDFSIRASVISNDETGELARTFNDMLTVIEEEIRERKQTEEALHRTEENLNRAQAVAHTGSWTLDIPANRLEWSAEIYRMFGVPQQDAIDLETFAAIIHLDDRDFVLKAWNAAMEGAPYDIVHRIVVKGETRWVRECAQIERDAEGRPMIAIGTVQDITELKLVEEALQQRTLELEELNWGLEAKVLKEVAKSREKDFAMMQQARLASMGEMISNIAHQWRQPLNGLGLIIQDLRDAKSCDELDEEYLEETIGKSMTLIDFMSHTIDDFRNFFRTERAKTSFNILEAIRDTLFLIYQQLGKQGISLTLRSGERSWELTSADSFKQVEPDLGECLLVGYSNEFKQALLNLVMNSRDAILSTGKKTGRIVVSHRKEEGFCCISIEDNGGGIPPEVLEKVFDPYFSTKEEGKGTGIGLYMSKTIIEEHMEGEIKAENTDEGAKFTITFKHCKS